MAKKKQRGIQVSAILIVAIFSLSLVAAFAVPLMTREEQSAQQEEINRYLEELRKQQAGVEEDQEPAEIDPNLIQEGEVTNMQIIDITTGTGSEAKLGDTIKVKYKGALASTGAVFDSNQDGVEFPLNEGGLIQGWIEGVPGMKVGGKRKLVIPSVKGYGEQGTQGIPPNSDLVFEIELLSVN
jgi:FKBP-type peptidyl-prolyl cis-trans isomerase FkpA